MTSPQNSRWQPRHLIIIAILSALATAGIAMVLITIFEHKQDAQQPFVRITEVNEVSTDPVPWGTNWPDQFDSYVRTVDSEETEYGGSSAMTQSKLDSHPWLKRLYAGYAFSIDYREARGHAYMLYDQEVTERVTKRKQAGACLHCHASVAPTYRRVGLLAQGKPADEAALSSDFNWPAVWEGFRIISAMGYGEAHAELMKTPDGTPDDDSNFFPGGQPPEGNDNPLASDPHANVGNAHPVGCIDCHSPKTMRLRITRPGFAGGIAALAKSEEPVPHLPSVEKWRQGNRSEDYDPNKLASRQEMRTFVCAQCHVEYYCANKETLFFPWDNGLKVEQIEAMYDNHKFPDGSKFYDYKHGETGAPVFKAQHPEFELFSQGIHARSGVTCADCHMPYERQGAKKVSSHWVKSPLLSINNSCQTCHNVPESELKEKVETIQARTMSQMERAATAMTDMLDAIRDAQAFGVSDKDLAKLYELQKKAMWRLDYISSENSKGFHADQEAVRILGESIDYSRQAQALALNVRAKKAPASRREVQPVEGVTPTEKAPK